MTTIELSDRDKQTLLLVHQHHSQTQIAKILKISKAAVSKIFTKLEKMHLLNEELPRSCPKTYKLTLPAYSQVNSLSRGGDEVNSPHYAGLHRISYRIDVKTWSPHFQPDHKWDLNNWSPGKTDFKNLEVRAGTKCLEFWWDEREANTPREAEIQANMRAKILMLQFEKAGFVFSSEPYPNREWKHSLLHDPFIRKLGIQDLEGKLFKIDGTPIEQTLHPKGELNDADKIDAYLKNMTRDPEETNKLRKEIAELKVLVQSEIDANAEVVESINKLIKKLTPPEPEKNSQMYG